MTPKKKAKYLLKKYLPQAKEQECNEIVDQIVAAVKQDVLKAVAKRLDLESSVQDKEKSKEYDSFYSAWKQRFTHGKMTEQEFAKTFGAENSRRLNDDLLEMILKGADIG